MSNLRYADVGRCFNVDRMWVKKVRQAVALVLQTKERSLIVRLAGLLREADKVNYSISTMAFDETQEKFCLPLHPGLMPNQANSSWHVCVSDQQVIFDVAVADEAKLQGGSAEIALDCMRPPMPLLSTNAESLWDGLWEQPAIRVYTDLVNTAATCSALQAEHYDTDAATSNERLLANRFDAVPATTLCSHWKCSNHQLNLAENSSSDAMDIKFIPILYSTCLLFRMGGTFLRLIHAVLPMVEASGQMRQGEPPAEAAQYRSAMRSYLLASEKNRIKVQRGRRRVGQCEDDEAVLREQERVAA